MNWTNFIVPSLFFVSIIIALIKKKTPYNSFVKGVLEGLDLSKEIFPSIMGMLLAVNVLKSCGIVDDLGVITYQLGVMFRNLGYDVSIAKEIYDAITKYKKQTFKLVIMDLFIPTDREGFILLDELVKLTKINELDTVIGVMTASSKKEYRQLCMKKGADFYIEKIEDWQNQLIEYCEKD